MLANANVQAVAASDCPLVNGKTATRLQHFVIWWIMNKARRIAEDLMTNGSGDVADTLRLVRRVDQKDLGGWSVEGLTARISKHLTGELDAMEREIVMLNEAEFVEDTR